MLSWTTLQFNPIWITAPHFLTQQIIDQLYASTSLPALSLAHHGRLPVYIGRLSWYCFPARLATLTFKWSPVSDGSQTEYLESRRIVVEAERYGNWRFVQPCLHCYIQQLRSRLAARSQISSFEDEDRMYFLIGSPTLSYSIPSAATVDEHTQLAGSEVFYSLQRRINSLDKEVRFQVHCSAQGHL